MQYCLCEIALVTTALLLLAVPPMLCSLEARSEETRHNTVCMSSFLLHSFSCTEPHGLIAEWCVNSPSRRFTGTRYQCNICGKSYGHHTSLMHHHKVHSGKTTCTICNKVLNRIFDLKMHLSFVHGINESGPE